MPHSETADKILDVAEKAARLGGYHAFSFRDIAAEIGIKSASVHYHFPTKEALGAALAQRYTERFLEGLGDPTAAPPSDRLNDYTNAYAKALKTDGLMCLCGMFGAEVQKLPEEVARQTREFFLRNLRWLEAVFMSTGIDDASAQQSATRMIATLEGALILARTLEDDTLFDKAIATPN